MQTSGSGAASLHELIPPAGVKLSLTSRNRDDVLAELVDLVPNLNENRPTLLRALQDRERLHSTGIGDGIALPHARNALVGLVSEPVIVLGRHDRGIAYESIDGKPARLFFLLVAPTVTQHLALLARISRVLHSPKLRAALLTVDRPENAIDLIKQAEEKLYSA
jgi:mannitol/fructose-specific phosphotransferase system IIA component (Ntr-type)